MSWTFERLMDLATGYWPAGALSAAVELNLFAAVEGRGATAREAAERVGASPRHVGALLDALAGMDILEKIRDRAGAESREAVYRLKPSAAQFLTPSGAYCVLDALRFNADLYPLWGRLAPCVREGKPALPPAAHLGADAARTRRFVMGMHSRALPVIPALLPALDMKGRERLLDLAAGPGTFSAALAERNPSLQVTLLDLPAVLDVARELLAARLCAPRFAFVPADYRADPLPEGFDAALFCGALHQEDPDSAGALFRKIREALRPGGRLYVVDLMLQPDRTAPLFSCLFSLNMALTSPGGRVFSDEEARGLLQQAGFENLSCRRLTDCPYWVIAADRPSSPRERSLR